MSKGNLFNAIFFTFTLFTLFITISFSSNAKRIKDTVHFRKTNVAVHEIVMSDSALNELGIDSLLNKVEHIHNGLYEIINKTGIGFDTREIEENIAEVDSNLELIDQNIILYSKVLDVKNLQMFEVLLTDMNRQLTSWRNTLFEYDRQLLTMSSELTSFRNDTLLKDIMDDSVFTAEYAVEIQDIKNKMKIAKKSIAENQARLKNLQVYVSNHYFETIELRDKTIAMLRNSSIKSFGKEYPFLWQVEKEVPSTKKDTGNKVKQSVRGQSKILNYYFKKNWTNQMWMGLTGILFFIWIYRNFKKMERKATTQSTDLSFKYITKLPLFAAFAVMFSVGPFFDMHPPTAYVEIMEFLLVIALTILLWHTWERKLFYLWFCIILFYVAVSVTGTVLVPTANFRWWLIILNSLAVAFGIFWLLNIKKIHLKFTAMIFGVSCIFILLNAGAIICNFYGRVSLAKIFSVTSIYGLTQIIGLSVFVQIILEGFELQTAINKMAGGVIGKMNFQKLEKLLSSLLIMASIFIWAIVFSVSLNVYDPLSTAIFEILTQPHKIGTTEFQVGNILVFIMIIYISNIFQQGIGSLYGREESHWDPEIKKNASRFAITRLLLIVVGFFFAVTASGLPIDKITIVLGALGVGIGLGLQTIVNNLVSGVILIFEQPFRIGDFIELGDKRGRVLDIGIRSSKILMEEGAEIIMPNADLLSGRVINWTLRNDNVRIGISFDIESGHDIKRVEKIIFDIAGKDEFIIQTMKPEILVLDISDKKVGLMAYIWINDVHKTQIAKSRILQLIYDALETNGIKTV